jgi:transposase InsO family protein
LRWLFSTTSTDGNPRIVRWKLALSAFDFTVEYRPGSSHKVADELSRMNTDGLSPIPTDEDIGDCIPCLVVSASDTELQSTPVFPRVGPLLKVPEPFEAISLEELLEEQANDPWCQDLLRMLERSLEPIRPPGLKIDDHGALCCDSEKCSELPPRWIVPASLRERVCTLNHFARTAGHPGATRMAETISRYWYWPSLGKDCVAMVRRCPACAAKRLKRGPKRSVPLTIFPPDRPLEFVALDILGPLPQTPRGHRFVLCITDRFSKMSIAVAIPDQTASTVARELVDRWIAVFGIPITIISDNGSAFASKFFGVLTHVLGVKHVFTSAYRPTTNGQVERWNATLADSLANIATEKDWDQHLGLVCTAYNATVHTSTGYAPIELACSRDPCPNVWTRSPDLRHKEGPGKQRFRHMLLDRAAKLCASARETNELRLERYKRLYDFHVCRRHEGLKIGDLVLVRTYVLEPGRSSKLSFPVAGPYPVVKIDGPNIDVRTREGTQRLHLDRVMRCPMDLPSGVEWAPRPEKVSRAKAPRDSDEVYVVDRLLSHARPEDGSGWLVRVRWAGFGADGDTWEPAENLPKNMLRKYERRKRLADGTLTQL